MTNHLVKNMATSVEGKHNGLTFSAWGWGYGKHAAGMAQYRGRQILTRPLFFIQKGLDPDSLRELRLRYYQNRNIP